MNIPNSLGSLSIHEGRVIFQFRFDRHIVEKCKYIGMRWNGKTWTLPYSLLNTWLFNKTIEDVLPLPVIMTPPKDVFYEPPNSFMMHQKKAVEFAATNPRHLFAHDTGTGKTYVGIELSKQKGLKTLVVCPLTIIENAWVNDLNKFAPGIKYLNLWKARRQQRAKLLDQMEKADMCLINFESFKPMMDDLVNAGFGQVLVDESSKIKNSKSQITKKLTAFCDNVYYAYLFSATPAPNTELEYFPQSRIVDPSIFGTSFYRFRNKYFYPTGFDGHIWKMKNDMRVDFNDSLAKIMTVVRKEDVLDLPERTFNIRDVNLSKPEMAAYKEMEKHLVLEIQQEEITAHNAAVKLMKLRQITAGFIHSEDGSILDIGDSKLRELLDLLDEIGNHQVIIWTQFQYEARLINKALHEKLMSIPDRVKLRMLAGESDLARIVNGTVPQAHKDQAIRDFKSRQLKYIIAHPRSMGHGVTLANASYAIYYSISYSHEEHKQSQDRIYRYGQHNACSYYYLLAPGTIERPIYNALTGKAQVEGAVLDYVKTKHKWGF